MASPDKLFWIVDIDNNGDCTFVTAPGDTDTDLEAVQDDFGANYSGHHTGEPFEHSTSLRQLHGLSEIDESAKPQPWVKYTDDDFSNNGIKE